MMKKLGCMLLSASFTLTLVAHAEKEAPLIENPSKESKEIQDKNLVPVALQQASPEAKSSDNAPIRAPSTIDESYKNPISHSLEPINNNEYLEAFKTGDKTSASIEGQETPKPKVEQ